MQAKGEPMDATMTAAAMIESATMVKAYEPGVEARKAIMAELKRREDCGEGAPTLREIGAVTGRSWRQARRYLHDLRDTGLIHWEPAIGRGGSSVKLTKAGRACLDLHG